MPGVARDEIPELRALREAYDTAREKMLKGIETAFAKNQPNARIARSVDWTREYVGKLRKDWEAGQPAQPSEGETGEPAKSSEQD